MYNHDTVATFPTPYNLRYRLRADHSMTHIIAMCIFYSHSPERSNVQLPTWYFHHDDIRLIAAGPHHPQRLGTEFNSDSFRNTAH